MFIFELWILCACTLNWFLKCMNDLSMIIFRINEYKAEYIWTLLNSVKYQIIFVNSLNVFGEKSVAFHLSKILIEWTQDNPEISMSNIVHIPIFSNDHGKR